MSKKLNLLLPLCVVLFTLAITSCDKIKSFTEKKPAPEAEPKLEVAATPIPTPTPESTPEAVAIDTHAEVVVLCYHRIEGKAGGALSIEPAEFERQMQALKDAGIVVISMQDFLAWRRGEKTIPPKSVVITIDDGYVSSYSVGWPILKKYGYPFTMYVYLKYINMGGKSITWSQLEEMRDAGVDIGCHTVSHQDLRRKPSSAGAMTYEEWLADEIVRSKQVLEDKLGIRVDTIAYPFGLHNDKIHAAVKAAGYEAAFTTYGQRLGHTTAAMSLGRYDVTTKDAQGRSSFEIAASFQGMMAPGATENVIGQDAAATMITQPMQGDTVNDPRPVIKANLASMGALEAGSLEMRVSGLGKVDANYDAASKNIEFKPSQSLRPGNCTVIVTGKQGAKKVEARWSFTVAP